MNIKINGNIVTINEPIIAIKDSEDVINAIKKAARKSNTIMIDVKNSFSFPSNIISALERLKDEGKNITIKVKEPILNELFKDLNLDREFKLIKE